MTFPIYFDSKKSSFLFGLKEQFDFLKNLFLKNKLPNILMISGKKGVGKSTLINHLMFFVFDREKWNFVHWQLKYDELGILHNCLSANDRYWNLFKQCSVAPLSIAS